MASGDASLRRALNPTGAISIVVGTVIGTGIFLKSAVMSQLLGSSGWVLAAWAAAGLLSIAGTLTYAELAAMLPQAGGPYVYLREAYGKLPAFLFGWTEFLVIRSGSVATLAAACAFNIVALLPLENVAESFPALHGLHPQLWLSGWAIVAMLIVATINVIGTALGGRVQIMGTILKVGALLSMIVLPFVLGKTDVARLSPVWPSSFGTQDLLKF